MYSFGVQSFGCWGGGVRASRFYRGLGPGGLGFRV